MFQRNSMPFSLRETDLSLALWLQLTLTALAVIV